MIQGRYFDNAISRQHPRDEKQRRETWNEYRIINDIYAASQFSSKKKEPPQRIYTDPRY